jgi:nucleotide-binding universal stress UspA family protein
MVKILATIDNNEDRAINQAETIIKLAAATSDIEVVLLHVFEDNPEGATVKQVQSVRSAKDELEAAGIEVEMLGVSGDPSEAILDYADDLAVDFITVSGRKRTPVGKVLLGSVSQQVLLHADQPVLYAPAEPTES